MQVVNYAMRLPSATEYSVASEIAMQRKGRGAVATDFKKALDKLVTESHGDWRVFIRQLGPVHAQWHAEHNNLAHPATPGFLLFHWELIERFRAVGADKGLGGLNGIKPYTEPQLANFGAAYTVLDSVSKGDVGELESFSGDLEAWHNDAHMAIGMATGRNLMNPRTNVRLREFWRLHYFINDRFEEQLANYSDDAVAATVASLEAKPSVVVHV